LWKLYVVILDYSRVLFVEAVNGCRIPYNHCIFYDVFKLYLHQNIVRRNVQLWLQPKSLSWYLFR